MTPDVLLNAYIDLNILLFAGTFLWICARKLSTRSKIGQSYRPQLRLLNTMTVLLAVSPFVAIALRQVVSEPAPNLTDILVSQYLQGNVSMKATTLQDMLGLREDVLRD